jgi:hypothetical protein
MILTIKDPSTKRTADYLSKVDSFVQGLTDAPAGMLRAFKQVGMAFTGWDLCGGPFPWS